MMETPLEALIFECTICKSRAQSPWPCIFCDGRGWQYVDDETEMRYRARAALQREEG